METWKNIFDTVLNKSAIWQVLFALYMQVDKPAKEKPKVEIGIAYVKS